MRESESRGVQARYSLAVEAEGLVELEEEVTVAYELCHSVLQDELIEADVVGTPVLDLRVQLGTVGREMLKSSGSMGSSLICFCGRRSTIWRSLIYKRILSA